MKAQFGKGPNIMTPDVEGYYSLADGGVIELASGSGFAGPHRIWGVSVRPDKTLGKLFQGRNAEREARDYIESLQNQKGK